jgi:phosphomannomutase
VLPLSIAYCPLLSYKRTITLTEIGGMMRDLPPFGTDGIRGSAEVILAGADAIGRAGGSYFTPDGGTILIGADTRESSAEIVHRLAGGMMAAGASVEIVGTIPTPGLAYLTRETHAAAGAMVTAVTTHTVIMVLNISAVEATS